MSGIFPSITPLINSLPFQKNNYEFLSVISVGSSSIVFKVQSYNYTSTYFAAKVAPKTNEYILRDLNALKSLIHSFIVSVYDFFEDDENYYIILEYCQNGTLSSLIKSGQILSKDEMVFYMRKLSHAIYFCHLKGISHRDIKPLNVLLDSYGRPKLIGFDISEALYLKNNYLNSEENESDGYYAARKKGEVKLIRKFFGSAPYLAPEIILKKPYDPFAADVWALGVTFYEIVNGSLPWNPESGQMMNDAICQSTLIFRSTTPSSIQQLITAMTQVDPKKRPSMRSISECSLFKSEIPKPLKIFTSQSDYFDQSNPQENPVVSKQEPDDRKLKKAATGVSFSNYQSFINNKNCNPQLATKSLVFKAVNLNGNRKRKSVRSSQSNVFKVYSSPIHLIKPVLNPTD